MSIDVITKEKKRRSRAHSIPAYLICEELDGQPLYYKGYKDVLSGKKTKQEVVAASGLLLIIAAYFADLIRANLERKKYWVFSGIASIHLDGKNKLNSNVCVYEKDELTPDKIITKHLDIAPKLVIEVDVSVDDSIRTDYFLAKTQNLLDFGTEKVVWIFTRSKKVFVAEPGKDWYFTDWHNPVLLLEGISCNVAEYLAAEGIEVKE